MILAVCYGKDHEAHIELIKLRDKVKAGGMRGEHPADHAGATEK